MEILWWLAPTVVVTAVAMLWAVWAGRDRAPVRDEQRFAEALMRDSVVRSDRVVRRPERGTGIAVRGPSRPAR